MSDKGFRAIMPYRKVVISGNVIEVYEMQSSPYTGGRKSEKSDVEWILEYENELREDRAEKLAALEPEWQHAIAVSTGKLQRNIMRTRNMVRRLTLSNFDTKSKFWTFTYDDNKVPPEISRDVQSSNQLWDRFIKRMRRRYGKFKYLAVLEFQKRGAVHYHCLFDLPYIKQKEIQDEVWGHGFVSVNRIRHVDNLGAYVVKYMTKDLMDERLFRNMTYLCSKGLNRPVEYRGQEADRLLQALELEKKKEVYANSYESEYLGKIVYKEYNLLRVQ